VYAIVRAGGRQEKVAVGDVVEMDRISGKPGDTMTLTPLMIVDGDALTTDTDALAKVTVTAELVDHFRGPKIKILNYHSKTGYRRRMGYRHDSTRVKITNIQTGK
jgi:large subunit ribosomal protein L21